MKIETQKQRHATAEKFRCSCRRQQVEEKFQLKVNPFFKSMRKEVETESEKERLNWRVSE